MRYFKYVVNEGDIFRNKENHECVVIDCSFLTNIKVKALGGVYEYIFNLCARDLYEGRWHHKTMPAHSNFNKGFIGFGKYKAIGKLRDLWRGIFYRCYDKKYLEKHPTYIGCGVHPDWYDFQVFANDIENKFGYNLLDVNGKCYYLDKEIVSKGNLIYSNTNTTTVFVPQYVNIFFRDLKKQSYYFDRGRYRTPVKSYKTEEEAIEGVKEYRSDKAKFILENYEDKVDSRVIEEVSKFII